MPNKYLNDVRKLEGKIKVLVKHNFCPKSLRFMKVIEPVPAVLKQPACFLIAVIFDVADNIYVVL